MLTLRISAAYGFLLRSQTRSIASVSRLVFQGSSDTHESPSFFFEMAGSKAGGKQATLGYVRDSQLTLGCVDSYCIPFCFLTAGHVY